MQIKIHTSARKVMALGICIFLIAVYSFFSLRAYLAYRAANSNERTSLEEAVRLEPLNAEYREVLGRHYFFVEQDLPAALKNYRTAVALNPNNARCWLAIAMACLVNGDNHAHVGALKRAIAADPTTPDTAWQAANAYLVQGDIKHALGLFRVVLEYDDSQADSAIRSCWRSVHDPDLIMDDALPRRADRYISFLNLLVQQHETAAANRVWSRLISLGQPFSPDSAFPYVQLLIDEGDGKQAAKAWHQLAALDLGFSVYEPGNNLIVNGGFENEILDGAFGWRYEHLPHVQLSIDRDTVRTGTRSLSISFDLGAHEPGVSQAIAVEPHTKYHFSAEYAAEGLSSASGPRFLFLEGKDKAQITATDEMLAPGPWHKVEGSFMTSPSTSLVILTIGRRPEDPLIRGRLIIDNVRLEQAQ